MTGYRPAKQTSRFKHRQHRSVGYRLLSQQMQLLWQSTRRLPPLSVVARSSSVFTPRFRSPVPVPMQPQMAPSGVDDTPKYEIEVLEMIANFLDHEYQSGMLQRDRLHPLDRYESYGRR